MVSTIFGISEDEEKSFNRTYICIEKENKIYKILSLLASKKDGSVSVFFNYCKEKEAFIFRHKRAHHKPGVHHIDKSKITDEFSIEFDVDKNAKLSLHQSGFVQLSGNGILSGIDSVSGKPKGVGVFSSPLSAPVSSGPTFGSVCWGIEKGFELLEKQDPKAQYLILKESDFTKRYINENRNLNSYVLEFFIFPKEANNYIYDHEGKPYINHAMPNYFHDPGALIAHPVLDIKFFEGVIAVFPVVQWTGLAEKCECGYSLASPGGTNIQSDPDNTIYSFHLICPRGDMPSFLGDSKVKNLQYKANLG